MIINESTIQIAKTNFLSLDEMAYLFSLCYSLNWDISLSPNSLAKLSRLGYIKDSNISVEGENLVASYSPIDPPKISSTPDDKFEEIWKLFPRDDEFRHFGKTRMIRWNKQETKLHYLEALKEYPHEKLVDALLREIAYRSTSNQENLFKYMKGSVNYFKTKAYEEFIHEDNIEYNEQYGKDLKY